MWKAFTAALLLCAGTLCAAERELAQADGEPLRYTLLDEAAGLPRAVETSRRLHERLASGDLEGAALLSNAPRRRYEVLRDYRERVGEEEFRRVYQAYRQPQTRLHAEIARGARRLVIWELPQIQRLAGEYYIEVEGRMLLDDVPSEERLKLRRILRAYRAAEQENQGQTRVRP